MKKRRFQLFTIILSVAVLCSFFAYVGYASAENPENISTAANNESQMGNATVSAAVYMYSEIAMNGNSLTMSKEDISGILNDSTKEGLMITANDGGIIMNREYLSSLWEQMNANIVFTFAVKDNTCIVSAKSNDSVLYGKKGLCLGEAKVSAENNGYVMANNKKIGISAYFADASVMRWQMASSESYTFASSEKSFTDMNSHWAKDNVSYMAARDIVNGMTATTFAPDAEVTRGQFITFLARSAVDALGTETVSKFSDVKSGDYFYSAVAWGVNKGIVNGTSTTTFSPNEKVTRQDMATMCGRYITTLGMTVKAIRTPAKFADTGDISDYAMEAVAAGYQGGFINGMGNNHFEPKSNATRAEAVTMIAGMIYYITAMPH